MANTLTSRLPVADIIEWDVLNWSQLIHYWQPLLEQLPRNSKVLAIGERGGGLALWLALQGFDVVCTDVTDISGKAGQLHRRYGVEQKITYKLLDIVNDEWAAEEFDIVIAKSVIGGLKAERGNPASRSLEVQQKAMYNIYRQLKPGGYFFSAENLAGNSLAKLARRLKAKHTGWRHPSLVELNSLFTPYSIVQIKTFGILPTFFSGKMLNRGMYLINKYVLRFLPANAKYIAFTVARK